VDTTLRDGEQAPGVSFRPEEKLQLARRIDAIGVGEIEAGTAAMGPELIGTVARMARLDLSARLSLWCRARKEDLDAAVQSGVSAVHLSLPVSPVGLEVLGRDSRWALRTLCKLVTSARGHFAFVSVGAQDASRADATFLEAFALACRELGVDRLRISDTVGIWSPDQTGRCIRALHETAGTMQLGFHGHNDLGLATANALAALQAGAHCVDVTVNGLGERAGNAALEEVVMSSKVAAGMDLAVRTGDLVGLCRHVANLSGRPLPVSKPICGEGVFRHESGIHVRALLRDGRAYEPFAPEQVGHERRQLVVGTHSGRAGLRHALADAGVQLEDDRIEALLEEARQLAGRLARHLKPEEVLALVRKGI
jgi:homocitrate synthase NifV